MPEAAQQQSARNESGQRSFSIRARVLLTISLVLLVGLGGIAWAIDSMYANAVLSSIHERLTSTLNLLVSSIDETDGRLRMEQPPDSRLQQPGSNLTAGMRSDGYTWLSASSLQTEPQQWPHAQIGVQDLRRVTDFFAGGNPQFVMTWDLNWETETAEVLPLHLWAAVDLLEYQQPLSAFRAGTWRWLAILGLLLLSLQLLIGWLGMKPLRRVEREIIAIEQGRKLRMDGDYPKELLPLTENLNALLDSELLCQQQYRTALGNLGHAMKTPLAVLSSILQQEQVSAADLVHAQSAVRELHGVMRYQIERAASVARRTIYQPVEAAIQVERIVKSMRKIYPQTVITADIEPECCFYGEQRDLLEVLGNLLENACKYGSGKVHVHARRLHLHKRKPGLLLAVGNSGTPVAADVFQSLLQRGLRGDERVEGDGLGLAIVAEIADAYKANLYSRDSTLGGLEVMLEFA